MNKIIGKLDLELIRDRSMGTFKQMKDKHPETFYADENIFITLHDFRVQGMEYGQPYQVGEGRLMMVREGWVRVVVNLEEFLLKRHSAMLLTPDSIIEIQQWDQDFDMQAFSFKDLPLYAESNQQACFMLNDDDWELANQYFQLIWHCVHRPVVLTDVIQQLQTALLTELSHIARRESGNRQTKASRHEQLLHRFLKLVNVHGLNQRKIAFYADRLCITPNHLGAVIRQASGLTVVQWLNRYAVQQAKLLLRYTDLPIWEVAERLNFANPSFFTRFFHKETGITPSEFRNKN
ncbi:MAG: AraC family transcriptional regulator [Bacteroidaceae bacterium]|nr:AraC family transcriptional regulator [Bacteroidaceae bacterium]